MTTIFISHSSRDDEFVTQLAESLHEQQYETWVDHQDTPEGMYKYWMAVNHDLLDPEILHLLSEKSADAVDWLIQQGVVEGGLEDLPFGFGAAAFVTGSFGFAIAARVVNDLTQFPDSTR